LYGLKSYTVINDNIEEVYFMPLVDELINIQHFGNGTSALVTTLCSGGMYIVNTENADTIYLQFRYT
jgi:hypothetical protein